MQLNILITYKLSSHDAARPSRNRGLGSYCSTSQHRPTGAARRASPCKGKPALWEHKTRHTIKSNDFGRPYDKHWLTSEPLLKVKLLACLFLKPQQVQVPRANQKNAKKPHLRMSAALLIRHGSPCLTHARLSCCHAPQTGRNGT